MSKRRVPFLIPILFLFLLACKQKPAEVYPGYSAVEQGMYIHRYTIGEGKTYPQDSDFLEFSLDFYDAGGKVIPNSPFTYHDELDTLHFASDKMEFGIYHALSMLSAGDSCSFWLASANCMDTSQFYGWNPTTFKDSMIRIELKLHRILTAKEEAAEKRAKLKFEEELHADEMRLLELYLDTCRKPFPKQPDENGLFYYFERKGMGQKAKRGDLISIRYVGSFLNGEVFDASTMEHEALSFRLGEPGQVVKGIELMLHQMTEGDRVQLLLPSSLAFGSKGSGAGIVSPFKTITFALEILKINK